MREPWVFKASGEPGIRDCFRELDKMLSAIWLKVFGPVPKKVICHSITLAWECGCGTNGGLWSDQSRLKHYFDRFGMNNADDVSSLIVASYWRYLNGRPIELPRQIVYNKIARDEIKNGPKTGNLS